MDQVKYIKYNSLRKPEYRITTEIHEDEQGKWVIKRTGNDAAKPHLQQIAANRKLLEKGYYKKISVLDITTGEDDRLRFPFVAGKSLAESIDSFKLEKDKFIEKIEKLLEQVLGIYDDHICAFEPTEGFISCFGNEFPEKGIPAVCPANLDSVFSNFIETKEGLVCLDYEWVYDFPIPVDYIKYRCIRYFYNEREKSLFDGIPRDTVMEWFGYDRETLDLYWNMESHFQQQIYGKDWEFMYLNRCKKGETTFQSLEDEIAEQRRIIQSREEHIRNLENEIRSRDDAINRFSQEISCLKSEKQELIAERQRLDAERQKWESICQEMTDSTSWKVTEPFRRIGMIVRKEKNHK